jgi:hypothetical protein
MYGYYYVTVQLNMTKKLSSKTLIRNESIAYISVKLIPRYIRLLV